MYSHSLDARKSKMKVHFHSVPGDYLLPLLYMAALLCTHMVERDHISYLLEGYYSHHEGSTLMI